MFAPRIIVEEKLKRILAEDVGQGDVTVGAIIPPNHVVKAQIIAKAEGTAAGLEEAVILSESLGLKIAAKARDGNQVKANQVLLMLEGDAQSILAAERTLLNLISRMSGIATQTRKLTQMLKKANAKAKIAATRKSPPGLLFFDKKAVVLGGGDSHRLHLDDMVLIKDNHVAILGSVEAAVKKAKANASVTKKIEAEAENLQDALVAAKAGADIVMLDNFSPKKAKEAVDALREAGFGGVLLEVSGGVSEENLLDFAKAQVDFISLGALTHSVKALDVSLEII